MCRVHTSGPAAQRHFRTSGGGIIVHQSYPEHVVRCVMAIRRRKAGESQYRDRSGEWA